MSQSASVQTAHLALQAVDEDVLCLAGRQYRAVLEVGSIAAIVAGVFILGRSPLVHCTRGSGEPDAESGAGALTAARAREQP